MNPGSFYLANSKVISPQELNGTTPSSQTTGASEQENSIRSVRTHRSPRSAERLKAGLGVLHQHLLVLGAEPAAARHFVGLLVQMRRTFLSIVAFADGGGSSQASLRAALWNACFTAHPDLLSLHESVPLRDFPVLLAGETGTGKSSAVQVIASSLPFTYDERRRELSPPPHPALVSLNVNSLTETLFESEVFGHRKGAFTGALQSSDGLLAQCGRHTLLFLDEIGDLPERQQTKLLEVLQERRYRPVGDSCPRLFEGRVIVATHRNVEDLVASGRMREDFYYRISSLRIDLPPLRTRLAEDHGDVISPLVRSTIKRALLREPGDRIVNAACAALQKGVPQDHLWPGNVREIEQLVRGFLLTGSVSVQRTTQPPASQPPLATDHRTTDLSLEELALNLAQRGVTLGEMDAALARAYLRQQGTYESASRRAGVDWRTLKKLANGG